MCGSFDGGVDDFEVFAQWLLLTSWKDFFVCVHVFFFLKFFAVCILQSAVFI